MEFPFVVELLEYWAQEPPTHILLKMQVGYEGPKAKRMMDPQTISKAMDLIAPRSAGAQKVSRAPKHIREAVERAKLGKEMDVPNVPEK
jgi:hypothetical protein